MKKSLVCPKCQGKAILHVPRLPDPSLAYPPLPVAVQSQPGLLGPTFQGVGRYEVYACAACGYAELYVGELDRLVALARKPDAVNVLGVRLLEGEAQAPGPYRSPAMPVEPPAPGRTGR